MGNIQSNFKKGIFDLFSIFKSKKKASIAILGLDCAGKSTLVSLFRDGSAAKINATIPTLGFNFDELYICNTHIKIWDVGGQHQYISFWKSYVENIDGLIFMIDIADKDRFEKSYNSFSEVAPFIPPETPVLLLLNKSDLIAEHSMLEEREDMIRKLYKVDPKSSSQGGYINIENRLYKNRIMSLSVSKDMEMTTNMGSNKTVEDTDVYSAFKWLIETISKKETAYF